MSESAEEPKPEPSRQNLNKHRNAVTDWKERFVTLVTIVPGCGWSASILGASDGWAATVGVGAGVLYLIVDRFSTP